MTLPDRGSKTDRARVVSGHPPVRWVLAWIVAGLLIGLILGLLLRLA